MIHSKYLLKHLFFVTTWNCNLKCKHCWVSAGNDEGVKIDSKVAVELAEQATLLGLESIKITGGEPFLETEILSALALFARYNHIYMSIESNGTCIDEEVVKKMPSQSHVSVSIDSVEPEVHNIFRGGKNAFEKTIAGIEMLKKYGIRFSIVFSTYGDNENDIENMIELAKYYGASSIKINPIMNIGKAAENFVANQGDSFLLDMDDIIRLYNRYEGAERGIQINMMVPYSLYFLKYISHKNRPLFTGCPQLNLLTVFPDLSVGLCSEARNQSCLLFGTYSGQNLQEIWNCSKEINLFRNEIHNNLKGICAKCKARAKCAGGCRALAGIAQGDCYASHPLCQYLWERGKFPLALYEEVS